MMPRLVIRQDLGALSIETKPAQMAPRQISMKMNSNYTPPAFGWGGKLPKVRIDQTDAFASAGLKPILRMSKENYNRSLKKGIEAIEKIVSEGLQFLRIEEGGNPAAKIARQNMEANHSIDITVASMPSVRPQIDVIHGDFQLDWSPSELSIHWERVAADDGHFTPGEINITWLQRPSIEITFEPGSEFYFPVNTGVGNNLDAAT